MISDAMCGKYSVDLGVLEPEGNFFVRVLVEWGEGGGQAFADCRCPGEAERKRGRGRGGLRR